MNAVKKYNTANWTFIKNITNLNRTVKQLADRYKKKKLFEEKQFNSEITFKNGST
jgi:hypothetical protein